MNLLVGLKQGCILNLVEFGCVGAEKKWGSVFGFVVWFLRKKRLTQLWVELSWVVAISIYFMVRIAKLARSLDNYY